MGALEGSFIECKQTPFEIRELRIPIPGAAHRCGYLLLNSKNNYYEHFKSKQ